mmetsp:Transcript_9446/g.31378  ORF Transcript_9446/g.31378 Transcript_9446/m.31378 type:complete len:270 (-) Transcript_9446:2036-2845(-)
MDTTLRVLSKPFSSTSGNSISMSKSHCRTSATSCTLRRSRRSCNICNRDLETFSSSGFKSPLASAAVSFFSWWRSIERPLFAVAPLLALFPPPCFDFENTARWASPQSPSTPVASLFCRAMSASRTSSKSIKSLFSCSCLERDLFSPFAPCMSIDFRSTKAPPDPNTPPTNSGSSVSSSSSSTEYVSIKSARSRDRMICEMIIHEIMKRLEMLPPASICQCITSKPSSPDAVTNRVSMARVNELKESRPASSSSSNTHAPPYRRVPSNA